MLFVLRYEDQAVNHVQRPEQRLQPSPGHRRRRHGAQPVRHLLLY